MDPQNPQPNTPQPQPVTPEPTPIPVTPATPVPLAENLVMPEPQVTAEPAPIPMQPAPPVPPAPAVPKPNVDAVTPTPVSPAPPVSPIPETDPLFEPVAEPDPIVPAPATVMPAPTPPVSNEAMQKLDDGPQPIINRQGQTVVASTSKAPKSRRKTILILLLGLALLAGVGYAVYTFYLKPDVVETTTPVTTKSVEELSPEGLSQMNGSTAIEAGGATNAKVITLSAKTPEGSPTGLSLQVEVQPMGTAFTDTPLTEEVAVPDSDDSLKVTLTDYPAGSYHWQARLTDGTNSGPWVAFATTEDEVAEPDFVVDRTAPAAAELKTINGRNVTAKSISSSVAQPVFTGTAEAGNKVTITLKEGLSYSATAGTDGAWSITASAAVPNARYSMTVVASDPAGNAATATAYTLIQSAN